MSSADIVDAGIVANIGTVKIPLTVKQDGVVLDLTGKTVTATIRAEGSPNDVINAALEDHAVDLVVAANGTAELTLDESDLQLLPVGTKPYRPRPFIAQPLVVEDRYPTQPVRISVHGVVD